MRALERSGLKVPAPGDLLDLLECEPRLGDVVAGLVHFELAGVVSSADAEVLRVDYGQLDKRLAPGAREVAALAYLVDRQDQAGLAQDPPAGRVGDARVVLVTCQPGDLPVPHAGYFNATARRSRGSPEV